MQLLEASPAEGARPPQPLAMDRAFAPVPAVPAGGVPSATGALPLLPPSPPATTLQGNWAGDGTGAPRPVHNPPQQQPEVDPWRTIATQAKAAIAGDGDNGNGSGSLNAPQEQEAAASLEAPDFASCPPTHDACSFLVTKACEIWNTRGGADGPVPPHRTVGAPPSRRPSLPCQAPLSVHRKDGR